MKKIVAIVILIVSLISCKKEVNSKKAYAKFSIDFPDTVVVNKYYEGRIIYKSNLDTITVILNEVDSKKSRMLEYAFAKTKIINQDEEALKRIIADTMYSKSNLSIPLFLKFNKLGVNYIDGIIKDEVWIDTIEIKNKKKEKKMRIITNEFRATKKVVVIDDKTPALRRVQ
ncbi:hypothetical protein [Flavobacterium sp. LHD-85]|uniref:hypothetical protein n=1 Tax=Flavobacterium sp. LHD-85 TaxID=3071410 RepID=UPI0027E1709C|nr:hypothetical protein [Flavobacterium sp. LHD-85]MDQ6528090.1 hypothetical protein [Flavobacterium sp. LHD-85]